MRNTVPLGVILAYASSLLSGSVATQSTNVHQSTTQPPDGRFEIVQSPQAAKWTFRLDGHRGNVDQLVETQDGALTWQGRITTAAAYPITLTFGARNLCGSSVRQMMVSDPSAS